MMNVRLYLVVKNVWAVIYVFMYVQAKQSLRLQNVLQGRNKEIFVSMLATGTRKTI